MAATPKGLSPAFPQATPPQTGVGLPTIDPATPSSPPVPAGLSVREYFAARIIQGMVSGVIASNQPYYFETVAEQACGLADALVTALEASSGSL